MEVEIPTVTHHGQFPEPAAWGAAPEGLGIRNRGIKEMIATFGSKVNAVVSA